MRGLSHRCLGQYLADRYMAGIPQLYVDVFLLGCIEPDRNPATYLKGSVCCQWLRGHNYRNSRRFMKRISRRLEKKSKLSLFNYYTLGKLIHYTADAFTYAHNADFPSRLSCHMEYEAALQDHFLSFIAEDPKVDIILAENIMDAVYRYHKQYEEEEHSICKDSRYALTVCCCVLATLFAKPLL